MLGLGANANPVLAESNRQLIRQARCKIQCLKVAMVFAASPALGMPIREESGHDAHKSLVTHIANQDPLLAEESPVRSNMSHQPITGSSRDQLFVLRLQR